MPCAQQRSSHHGQIGQRTGDEQPVGVLGDTAVAHLGETEEALDHQKRMLDFGAHPRFVSILGPLHSTEHLVAARLDMRHRTDRKPQILPHVPAFYLRHAQIDRRLVDRVRAIREKHQQKLLRSRPQRAEAMSEGRQRSLMEQRAHREQMREERRKHEHERGKEKKRQQHEKE